MSTKIFDGKACADSKLTELRKKISSLKKKNITPGLVSLVVGDEAGAMQYQKMKQKKATEIGCELIIKELDDSLDEEELAVKAHQIINALNLDDNVHGIMIQLPFPKHVSRETKEALINSIVAAKDVDGMTTYSPYTTPVVQAIIDVLIEAEKTLSQSTKEKLCLVVGAKGFVGKRLLKKLRDNGWKNIEGIDIDTKNIHEKIHKADVLVSTTGEPEIIGKDMVKEGSILIDVGAPKGDISKDAYAHAAFVSPVPGGVGPVTISCLLENLLASVRY